MDYQKMDEDELRAEASSRQLNTSGDKDELIARLEHDDADGSLGDVDAPDTQAGLERNEKGEVYADGSEGTEEDADRSKQFPGAGDPKDGGGLGYHKLEDPTQGANPQKTGFVSTEDTKPGTTKAVNKERPFDPAVPGSPR